MQKDAAGSVGRSWLSSLRRLWLPAFWRERLRHLLERRQKNAPAPYQTTGAMRRQWSPYPTTLFATMAALILAAVLLVYFQRVDAATHRRQTFAMVEQMCIRAVGDASVRLRELLDGPYVRSIARTPGRYIRDYDLAVVLPQLTEALSAYPFVTEYYLWSHRMPVDLSDQVLFVRRVGPRSTGGSPAASELKPIPDPERGRAIFKEAQELSRTRLSYAVVNLQLGEDPVQLVVHFLWASPTRDAFHGVLGYVVNLDDGPRLLFEELQRHHLPSLLTPGPFLPPLELSVQDASGAWLYGRRPLAGAPIARAEIDGFFFPGPTLGPYLATRPPPRMWTLSVSAAEPVVDSSPSESWASGAAVVLILVAIGCVVSLVRHANRLASIQADFVANVSHQLKTPLTKLMGASDTLGLGRVRTPEKIEQYADIVRVETGRLWELVEELIAFSKVGSDGPRSHKPVDLVRIATEVVAEFSKALDEDTVVTFDAESPSAVVNGDAGALRQMLTNLVENAVQYGNGKPNHIVVRVAPSRKAVTLSVRDEGSGIHPEDLPHIFEKFYRGRGFGTRPPGFGLGLASVQSIVRAHSGQIAVRSQLGQGSEFEITLPYARRE